MISNIYLENNKNSICKIVNNSEIIQTGFFLQIKNCGKLAHFLITIYNSSSDFNEEIIVIKEINLK